jgi:large subunit ribosomal protein L25
VTTARPTLSAQHRDLTGKKVAHLRKQGRLPAVVFGHGVASANVSVDAHDFELLRRRIGPNALVDLSVDGRKAEPVLIHGVEVHPVTRRPLHADLFLVRMTEELTVDVPIDFVGQATAVEMHGGTLVRETETVRVRALPDHLPQRFELSIEPLVDFDARLQVRDLEIPAGVTLLSDPDETLAHVLPPRIEEEVVAPVAEAAPEAEAEAAEAAPAGEGEGATGS